MVHIQPTYDTVQAATLCDRSVAWIRATAAKRRIGQVVRTSWRFSPVDLRQLQALADPDERRGRPSKGGQ